jgi:hypothetical protein
MTELLTLFFKKRRGRRRRAWEEEMDRTWQGWGREEKEVGHFCGKPTSGILWVGMTRKTLV